MAYRVLLSKNVSKKIKRFSNKEKASLTKALNIMENLGQIGYPLFLEEKVWRYKIDRVRIIYKIEGNERYIVDVRNVIDDSKEKPDQYCFKFK